MTPEQEGRILITAKWLHKLLPRDLLAEMAAPIDKAIADAVAAEREACASVAEHRDSQQGYEIAAAIRARGAQKS